MKIVHLPMLKSTTSLKDALKSMRVHQRSAVVRQDPTNLHLIKIGKIFKALNQQLTELSNVNINEPVYRPTPAEIAQYQLNTRKPDKTHVSWQAFLDDGSHTYALVDWFLDTALIATQHEPDGEKVELSPEDCYCLGPDEHSLPPATMVPVHNCSACSFTVHCE